jgi:hypothetical protein
MRRKPVIRFDRIYAALEPPLVIPSQPQVVEDGANNQIPLQLVVVSSIVPSSHILWLFELRFHIMLALKQTSVIGSTLHANLLVYIRKTSSSPVMSLCRRNCRIDVSQGIYKRVV